VNIWAQHVGLFAIAWATTSVFALLLFRVNLAGLGQRVIATSLDGVSAMVDPDVSDLAKERALRRSGGMLLRLILEFAAWIGLAALAAGTVLVMASAATRLAVSDVIRLMLSLEFLIGMSLIVLGVWFVSRRKANRPALVLDAERQAQADQLVHGLAFASPWLSKGLAKMDRWAAARALNVPDNVPAVFITSLPRAGTTALLNAFHSIPGMASHAYRDMPFVGAPYLWSKLGGSRHVATQERAHGDGLQIDLDSPEAFDEVLWKLYWPEKYQSDAIALWDSADADPKKIARLTQNFRTISALRSTGNQTSARPRYLSKNNANIARLPLLTSAFPSAKIIVPLRRPAPHAASMHRQHLKFSALHADDSFSKRYMRDIGHFEFGALHTPIAFPGQADNPFNPADENYWLAYWIAAYRYMYQHRDQCTFVTQDDLRSDPHGTLQALAHRVELDVTGQNFEPYFLRQPDLCDDDAFDHDVLRDAEMVYADLANLAVWPGSK